MPANPPFCGVAPGPSRSTPDPSLGSGRVPLKLIYGPPNSGKRGEVLRAFRAALDRDPVLVLPTSDDVFDFERELCGDGALLGGAAMTFGALFRTVATAAGVPPGAELSPAQRLRAIAVAIEERRAHLRPLRRSAGRPRFAAALERLFDELQAAGIEPEEVEASAATLEGSAYLGDLATLYGGYEEVRQRARRTDAHGIAREAIAQLRRDSAAWTGRPVLLYGFDDLTENQLELVATLAERTEVTVALPYEEGHPALAARGRLLDRLRERIGAGEEIALEPNPGNTISPLLFHLTLSFGQKRAAPAEADGSLLLLRSAGTRAEAEADRRSRLPPRPRRRLPRPRSRSPCAIPRGAAPRSPPPWRRTTSPPPWRPRCRWRARASAAPSSPCWSRSSASAAPPTSSATCAVLPASRTAASTGSSGGSGAAASATPRPRCSSGRARRASRRATSCACGRRRSARRRRWRPRSAPWRRRWPRGRCATRRTGRAPRAATGSSCGPPRRSPPPSPSSPSWATWRRSRRSWPGRSPSSTSAPGRDRSRDGSGSPAPTASAPPASTTSSSAPCRTASSPAATAAPTPSSPTLSGRRWGSTRGATAKPRSATSSTPASPFPAAASSSPTATATRTAPRRRARRCSTTCGRCWRRRRRSAASTRSRRRSPSPATSPRWWRRWPRHPRRTSWRGRSPPTAPAPTLAALLREAEVERRDRGPAGRAC